MARRWMIFWSKPMRQSAKERAAIRDSSNELLLSVASAWEIEIKRALGKLELPANVQLAPAHQLMPRAANVAMLGLQRLMAGEQDNVIDLEPWYIRRSEAEVLWEKRHPEAAK